MKYKPTDLSTPLPGGAPCYITIDKAKVTPETWDILGSILAPQMIGVLPRPEQYQKARAAILKDQAAASAANPAAEPSTAAPSGKPRATQRLEQEILDGLEYETQFIEKTRANANDDEIDEEEEWLRRHEENLILRRALRAGTLLLLNEWRSIALNECKKDMAKGSALVAAVVKFEEAIVTLLRAHQPKVKK